MSDKYHIDKGKIDAALDAVCELGCKRVNEMITELDDGLRPEHVSHLNTLERLYLLDELKQIMRAYA